MISFRIRDLFLALSHTHQEEYRNKTAKNKKHKPKFSFFRTFNLPIKVKNETCYSIASYPDLIECDPFIKTPSLN